ncbi:MAG TPA: YCF48-related protein [Puia sp.]|nr:YCF48-related protein [Puia sp.]
MHTKTNSIIVLIVLIYCKTYAQEIQVLTSAPGISLRGLSVVDSNIIWVSGSGGTVARSTDGGKDFQWIKVKDHEKRDFRDIEAFDSNTALIMAVAEPAIILKTKDGGLTWKEVFRDSTAGMFLDAMDFAGGYGIVVGDPVNRKIFMADTEDYGESWKISSLTNKIAVAEGEAFFASSGTNLKLFKDKLPVFVSGGKKSFLYFSSVSNHLLPLSQGGESMGANSLALSPDNSFKGIVVGGDFAKDTASAGNCTLITLMPFTFQLPITPPHGYRSCVAYITESELITCGTNGVDISNDGGINWRLISREGFHVCQKAKAGSSVFLAGSNGRIAKFTR